MRGGGRRFVQPFDEEFWSNPMAIATSRDCRRTGSSGPSAKRVPSSRAIRAREGRTAESWFPQMAHLGPRAVLSQDDCMAIATSSNPASYVLPNIRPIFIGPVCVDPPILQERRWRALRIMRSGKLYANLAGWALQATEMIAPRALSGWISTSQNTPIACGAFATRLVRWRFKSGITIRKFWPKWAGAWPTGLGVSVVDLNFGCPSRRSRPKLIAVVFAAISGSVGQSSNACPKLRSGSRDSEDHLGCTRVMNAIDVTQSSREPGQGIPSTADDEGHVRRER